jgi:hypothetical protein
MKKDLNSAVKNIAKFLEIPCDDLFAEYVASHSDFSSMKKQFEVIDEEKVALIFQNFLILNSIRLRGKMEKR